MGKKTYIAKYRVITSTWFKKILYSWSRSLICTRICIDVANEMYVYVYEEPVLIRTHVQTVLVFVI